jgi:hypothetical protein
VELRGPPEYHRTAEENEACRARVFDVAAMASLAVDERADLAQ